MSRGFFMQYRKMFFYGVLGVIGITLMGCSAIQTEFGKQNLDVQTRMTRTIFLDPVAPEKRKVFVDVKNTSGKNAFDLKYRLMQAIANKGYVVETDPTRAHFLVQANVLQIAKINLNEMNCAFDSGFGGAVLGSALAGAVGGDSRALLGAGLAGALVGIAADSMVKDNYYTIITDVQLAERVKGTKGEEWRKYPTRIISTANKANLQLAQATPLLVDELVNSISGLM